MNGSQPKNLKYVLKKLRWVFITIGFMSLIINLLLFTVPFYMIQVYDRVLGSRSEETLVYLTLISIAALLVYGLLYGMRSQVLQVVSDWTEREVSRDALKKSFELTLVGSRYGTQSLKDLNTIRQFFTGGAILTLFDFPWTPLFIVVIYLLHPYLGILSIFGAIFLFSLAVANELSTRNVLKSAGTESITTQSRLDSALKNADVIQAMGMLGGILDRWSEKSRAISEQQNIAGSRNNILMAIAKFARMALQLGILGLGAYLVIKGEMTSGGMIAGSILMGRALAPVEMALGSWKHMISARDAYQRLEKHIAGPDLHSSNMLLPEPKGFVQVETVSFAYPKAKKLTLAKVNFAIQPGESVGIIGPSASGKSTLVKLIAGVLQPSAGVVRMDSVNVFQCSKEVLGKYIGYLPQDIELFEGSIKENIARLGEVDEQAVLDASLLANVHELILRLPNGYETEIGESGNALSGGQKQRIALARAFYRKPKLIILDEPNSNLDSEGEAALIEAIQRAKEWGATVITIAQKPAVIQGVDRVLILREGVIAMYDERQAVFDQLQVLAVK